MEAHVVAGGLAFFSKYPEVKHIILRLVKNWDPSIDHPDNRPDEGPFLVRYRPYFKDYKQLLRWFVEQGWSIGPFQWSNWRPKTVEEIVQENEKSNAIFLFLTRDPNAMINFSDVHK